MTKFVTKTVAEGVASICGMFNERMYLVEGSHTSALIDSGSGYGSLLEAVKRLTSKPVILLLTHGHTDHVMGAGEFQDVWFNEADRKIYRQHSDLQFRLSHLTLFRKGESVAMEDVIPPADPSRFHPLREGDRFDLGDVTLEAFACLGHTPGSMIFLDRKRRLLFSGDAFSNSTMLLDPDCFSVEGLLHSLLSCQARLENSFDRVLEAHGNGELPANIMDGVIDVCRELLAGQSDRVPYEFHGLTGFLAKKRKPHSLEREDGGTGNVIYQEERLLG